ncbi:S1C family serine protease [Anaerococcus sp. Marseille-P3625]|uniref:S1C family serine protease n=1 Tax=Anaerococcus sp. Marseille-P3625 TaxID=1977277 RepID=UPI000C0711C1|nr:trypsin-like peptidase domain-containing protein [Anaerococcus sp. Marseille-P3625]
MANRDNSKKQGLPSFVSALLGAIVGGILVYVLTTTISVKSNDQKASNEPSKQIEEVENASKANNNKKIEIKENESMESVVVKKSIDSVVGITTVSKVVKNTFFGPQSGYAEGVGSGSIVSKDGYIVTNSHVVSDGDVNEINVLFSDGSKAPAKLVWNDATLDLAVVKVDKENLPVMELGDSDKVGVGDRVVAIGNPLGLELQSTVTSGIISGLNRTVSFNTGAQMDGLMQTDAAINAGNSGGALLNAKGEQIAINTAKAGNSDGIGFAIPINIVKPVIDQIKQNGKFNSVYLGITGQSLDYFLQYPQINLGDLKDKKGVVVASVFDDNDLLKKGDLITAIDGNEVTDMISLKKQLLNYKVGDSAKITVYRDGKTMDIDFTFTLDSSKVDQYKQANPDNKIENNDKKERGLNPFFNLP